MTTESDFTNLNLDKSLNELIKTSKQIDDAFQKVI